MTGEGLQILTYTWHLWLLSSEGSFSEMTLINGCPVYNGHLLGPVTLKSIAQRLEVELSLHVFTIYVCRGWNSNTKPSACGANALIHCTTAAA